ncbi:MAG: MoaD/ThiS family protein [Halarsenatibacteraceae bacterium]
MMAKNELANKSSGEYIYVNLYGGLEKYSPTGQRKGNRIESKKINTVRDIIDYYQIPDAEARVILLKGRHVKKSQQLSGGETISIFPLLGGG